MMAEVGRRRYQKNAKRRTEAINFLANISLDGSVAQTRDSPVKAQVKNESRGEKEAAKIAPEKWDKRASLSSPCVDQSRDTTELETDGGASASEAVLSTGANEGVSPDPRGRTRSSISKTTSAGVSSASLRLKHSFSSEKGPLLIPTPSKYEIGSRPRAQTQVLSAEDLAKRRPQQGVVVGSQVVTESATHKPHHHHGLHHHHRHHTTPATSLSTDTEHTTALAPSSDRPTVYTGAVYVVHSLPHHQAKPSRMLMVSSSKVPFSLFSILPYSRRSQHGLLRNDSDGIVSGRTRKSSGTRGMGSDLYLSGLAGVDLGDAVKEVSYCNLLVPTKDQAAYRRQHSLDVLSSPHSPALRKIPGHPLALPWDRGDSDVSSHDLAANLLPYDPVELDDPGLHAGKHTKVLTFSSYMVSILDYTKPSELKKDINQKFKEKFPHIDLSLSKLRSIKREMRRIAIDAGTMEMLALAHAYVYFEKLVLYGKISKENRKLCAGACLTLASKLNDIKGAELQNLIKEIEDTFRENRKDFLQLEFPILVALEFSLHLPESVVLPHYRRIAQLT